MTPLRAADVVDEGAKFLAKGNEHLVLVLDGLCDGAVRLAMCKPSDIVWAGRGGAGLTIQEGDQLLAGALRAQGEGNSRKPVDSIETE